jgi:hypothetical protein
MRVSWFTWLRAKTLLWCPQFEFPEAVDYFLHLALSFYCDLVYFVGISSAYISRRQKLLHTVLNDRSYFFVNDKFL